MVKTNHQHVVINWMIFRFRFENRIVISFGKNISLWIRMNYKVVFHKITWSKFMLIFPLFFFFGDGTKIIFWDFDTFTYVATCEMYVVTPRRRRLSRLYKCSGCFTIHWPLLVAKILIFPKELTRKMQIEGTQTWIYICMHVIRWFTNYQLQRIVFKNFNLNLVTYLWNTDHRPVAWLHFLSFCNS